MRPPSNSRAREGDIPTRCAVVRCCTTERYKTHKTDSSQVVYRWHPWYGREVTIYGERNRRGTIVFICRIGGDEKTSPLEVPAWMFDTAICCACRSAPAGVVTVDGLRSLCRTLTAPSTVIEAEHPTITLGGSDAQAYEDSSDPARAVSSESPDPAGTSVDRSEDSNSASPAPSSIRRSRDGRRRPSGGPA
jgi:hypothetical protein